MDKKNVLAVLLIGLIIGFVMGAKFMQDDKSFKLHKTRSGTFIIDDHDNKGSHIFEVLELPTNKTSFQNQDMGFDK